MGGTGIIGLVESMVTTEDHGKLIDPVMSSQVSLETLPKTILLMILLHGASGVRHHLKRRKKREGMRTERTAHVVMTVITMKIEVIEGIRKAALKEEVLELAMAMTEVGLAPPIYHIMDLLLIEETSIEMVPEVTMKTIEVDLVPLTYHMGKTEVQETSKGRMRMTVMTKI
jgi:hypothetical protein